MNSTLILVMKWALAILSIPFIYLLIRQTMGNMKALSNKIDEYNKEQEAQKQRPGPINPYQDMGSISGVSPDSEDQVPKL